MTLVIQNHSLQGARQLPSPNCSERDPAHGIELLVIHNISLPPGRFGTGCIDQLFCNELDPQVDPYFQDIHELRVSAHILIDRAGEVTQYVPFHHKAWHAGESVFEGRENCNDFSIGIELEGTDDTAFTEAQYGQLVHVSTLLIGAYPGLHPDRIVGHSDVAPGRKTDPGPHFDWRRFRRELAKALSTQD